MATLKYKVTVRRGTAAQWTSANPVLEDGEEGYETDTKKKKIGDGATAWASLGYSRGSAASKDTGTAAGELPLNSDRDGRNNTFTGENTFSNQLAVTGDFLIGTTTVEDTVAPSQFDSPTFLFKDPLRASLEAASGGRCTVMYDDLDYPSYMVRIPAFNLEDIDADFGTGRHPAFIVNGTEKAEIWIGMHQAYVYNSRALSLPGLDPKVSIDFDDAKTACTAKGTGWHLMSNWEWAAVALWVLKQVDDSIQANQPRGNTDYGTAHDEIQETGTRQDGATYDPGQATGFARILTGSGPHTWRHDLLPFGISDLVGNAWEWVDGLKIDGGLITMPADNYYGLAEASWPTTVNSESVYLKNNSSTLEISAEAGVVDASINNTWATVTETATFDALAAATRNALMAALIAPRLTGAGASPFTTPANGTLYANTSGGRLPLRGGFWSSGSNAGLGALILYYLRSGVVASFGFRPAFVA